MGTEDARELLLALLGLQLAWPQQYREFHGAVFANEAEEWLKHAGDDQDRRLSRYVKHILSERCQDSFFLQRTLQLTAAVAVVDKDEGHVDEWRAEPDTDEVVELTIRMLLDLGFVEARSENDRRVFARGTPTYYVVQVGPTMAWVRRRERRGSKSTPVGQFFMDHDGYMRLVATLRASLLT